jgi:lipopolysaccharide export system protein LptA
MSMTSRGNLRAVLLAAVAIALCGLGQAPVEAQTVSNTFGGFSKNSDQPIDIESDVLVVHDAQKYATFKGNVKAVQGSTTLRATELDVHYVGGGGDSLTKGPDTTGATPAADTKSEGAGGGIASDQDQTTTSDWALYDVPAQMVTVGGNVVLMQGKNVLKGDRLVIDLKTGESRFENKGNTEAGGRIRALFMPEDAKPGDDSSKDGKSGGKKSADKSGEKAPGKGEAIAPQPAEAAPPAEGMPMPLLPGAPQ